MDRENYQAGCSSSPCYEGEGIENNLDRVNTTAIELLQSLLAAERAGARIARESGEQAISKGAPADLAELIGTVQQDEVRYCGMLMGELRRMGQEPGQDTGDFYGKCMAIEDMTERLAFLNRGQGWVVRKIEGLIPTLLDLQLIAALSEMRDTHVRNIEKTDRLIG